MYIHTHVRTYTHKVKYALTSPRSIQIMVALAGTYTHTHTYTHPYIRTQKHQLTSPRSIQIMVAVAGISHRELREIVTGLEHTKRKYTHTYIRTKSMHSPAQDLSKSWSPLQVFPTGNCEKS